MTDLHTHILPGMDDGAQDTTVSLTMLREQSAQGVTHIALTPHFYPERESVQSFLTRRADAWDTLKQAIAALPETERRALPHLHLGAEVAWTAALPELRELELLCYVGTRLLLLELPFQPWETRMFRGLNELMNRRALTPVIAHIDRYFQLVSKAQLAQLLSLGLPVQVTAEALLHLLPRRRALPLLRDGSATLLISDCHDMSSRPPNLAGAYAYLARKCSPELVRALCEDSDALLAPGRE